MIELTSSQIAKVEEAIGRLREVAADSAGLITLEPGIPPEVMAAWPVPVPDEIRLLVKRATDIVLASVAILVLLPFMVIIALLVRLTSRGPAIFRQERCGLNGRKFTFYKFRSMCYNAEELKSEVQHLSRRATALKIPNDPRLTPIGRFLRKFSIDEWPQLWNILRGDMSLVGPRPAVPDDHSPPRGGDIAQEFALRRKADSPAAAGRVRSCWHRSTATAWSACSRPSARLPPATVPASASRIDAI